MNKTDYPVKKTFTQDFILKNKTLFTLEYEQATIEEFFEFNRSDKSDQANLIYEMINKQIPCTFLDKIKKLINKNYKNKIQKIINYEKIILNIVANKFRTYESVFSDIDKRAAKKSSSK
jgi:hypothetical protein